MPKRKVTKEKAARKKTFLRALAASTARAQKVCAFRAHAIILASCSQRQSSNYKIFIFEPYMIEYRLAKGWRIFIYILSPAMIAVFIGALVAVFTSAPLFLGLIMLPIFLGMAALFAYVLVDAYKGRFTITSDRVILKSPLAVKTLMLDEIGGFRVDKNYIHLIPSKAGQKRIKISRYVSRSREIIEWASLLYIDLEVREGDEEESMILHNQEFGITEEARKQRLQEAKKMTRILNLGGGIVFAWLFISPRPYAIAVAVGLIYPLLLMTISYIFRGLIKVEQEKGSTIPSLALGFTMSTMAVTLRALLDFNILIYDERLWIIVSVFSVALFFLYLLPAAAWKAKSFAKYLSTLGILMLMFAYSYSFYVMCNCLLDKSEPQVFHVVVAGKNISKGKSQTRNLILGPWDTLEETQEVKVNVQDFDSVEPGDSVLVIQRSGFLETVWIEVPIK